jgi:spectinomycin phosphotransferase
LIRHLAQGWGVAAEAIHFVPEGFGSYHWVVETGSSGKLFLTVDDLDGKPWLGHDRESVYVGLRSCFDATLFLNEQAGLEFVLAPITTTSGASLMRICERYTVAAFPFLVGTAGRWGEPVYPELRDDLMGLLGRLHEVTPRPDCDVPARGWALPGRAALEGALADLDQPWGTGPYGEPARRLVAARNDEIERWLARYDDLAGTLAAMHAAGGDGLVVTHGEPHPGNVLRTEGAVHFIDWDTVALAPRERDLWMFAAHGNDLARYAALTGRPPDPRAIEFYGLCWALQDVAAFVSVLREPHRDDPDARKTWGGLNDYFLADRQVYPWA